jgi:Uma2 family endonuclease
MLLVGSDAAYNCLVGTDRPGRQQVGRVFAMAFQMIDIEYPETDGRPMGETDLHRDWMVRIIDLLKHRYRGQQVYVTGDLLLYYEEGDPSRYIVPDAMVVKDCDPGRRRVFKLWEENRLPCVVFETTSKYTKREDSSYKPQLYERLRIREYFLYDPTADYLRPPLQGYRLTGNRYVPIEADAGGRFLCQELGLWLQLEEGELAMYDCDSGRRLLTEVEAEHAAFEAQYAALEAERAAHEAERAAHEAERAAREAAEAEVLRLRNLLKKQGLSE